MNSTFSKQRIKPGRYDRSVYIKFIFHVLGVFAIAYLLLSIGPYIAGVSPFLAVATSWTWFLLPGFILSTVLCKRLSWTERVPVAFVLSLGIGTPIAILAILLRLELDTFFGFYLGSLALVLVVYVIHNLLSRPTRANADLSDPEVRGKELDAPTLGFVVVIILIAALLALLAAKWPPSGDDIAGLPYFADVLKLDRVTGNEPFHGTNTPATPRNELIVWSTLTVLVAKVSGTPPDVFFLDSRPILIILGFLALYAFLHQFTKHRPLALFLLSLWAIYLLSTTESDGTGNDMVTRIIQDKFIGWFIVVPIILVFMLWFLQGRKFNHLIGFSFAALAATLVHPITLTQVLILSFGFGLMYLFTERSRRAFTGVLIIGGVLLACLAIPVVQYIRYTGPMPVELAGLGDSVEYGRYSMALSRYRLWLMDGGRYVLHPSIILQPVIMAGYLSLPILLFSVKKNNTPRLIIAALAIMPILLYVPPVAYLVGKFVTPFLMWRLAWPLATLSIFSIGWVAWTLTRGLASLAGKASPHLAALISSTGPFVALIFLIWVLAPEIKAGIHNFEEELSSINYSTCSTAQSTLRYLDQLTAGQPVNVLASRPLNFCIPAYASLANVIEFRGYGTVNRLPVEEIPASLQRVADADYFSTTSQVDDLVISALQRWNIDYVLVEKERLDLELQFRYLSELFTPVYSDHDYTLFEVTKPIPVSAIIAGNAALREKNWDGAERSFTEALLQNPAQPLAQLGLARTKKGKGDLEAALAYYQEATRLSNLEPALHANLAETHLLLGDANRAIEEYQSALNLAPERYRLWTSLGLAYRLNHQNMDSQASIERSAALQAARNTAVFYSLLGDLFISTGQFSQAVTSYQQAIATEPSSTRYTSLAQAFLLSDDSSHAIQANQEAIRLNRWSDTPHMSLGGVYLSEDQLDQAIKEYETARRLNPANYSAFISLGQAIQQEAGAEAAITRLNELLSLNKALPGPHRALASIYLADGNSDQALMELDTSLTIQVKDATILATIGDIYRNNFEYDVAAEYYDKALAINPDQITARLGIASLYAGSAQYGLQMGQYLSIAEFLPASAWPRLYLASAYQRADRINTAQAEIEWALNLEPDSTGARVALGDLYRSLGRLEEAISLYQEAIRLDPENLDAYINLALAYEAMGEMEAAKIELEKAVNLDLDLAESWLAYGQFDRLNGDLGNASEHYRKAIGVQPTSRDAYFALSDILLAQDEAEAAKSTLLEARDQIPEDPAIYDRLAELELLDGKVEDAIRWLETGIQAVPKSGLSYTNLADVYMRRGDYPKARSIYLQAIQVDHHTSTAYLQLIALYKSLGQYQAVEALYATLFELFPGATANYIGQGDLYLQQGELDKAEAAYRKALAIPPTTANTYLALSEVQRLRGDREGALATLMTALEALPGSTNALLNLASFHGKLADYPEAKHIYEQAIAANRTNTAAYVALARIALLNGDVREASQTLEREIDANPTLVQAHLDLGTVFESMGEISQAEDHFLHAIALDRINPSMYQSLAQFYQRQKRYEEALNTTLQAIHISPTSAGLYLSLANTNWSLKRWDEALEWYHQAISSNPADPNTYLSLSSFYQARGDWKAALETLLLALETQPVNVDLHLNLGNLYKKLSRFAEAEEQYKIACALAFTRADSYISLANLYKSMGRWPEAFTQLKHASRADPGELSAYTTAGQIYNTMGLLAAAEYAYTQGLQRSQDRLGALSARGAFYADHGEWDQARSDYEAAWEDYPYAQAAGIQLAALYEQRGYLEKALDIQMTLNQLPTTGSQNQITIGDLHTESGNWPAAIAAYENAIQLDPTAVEAYSALAQVYLLQNQPEEALRIYQAAVQAAPDEALAYINLGSAYQSRLDFQAAQAAFEKALELEPYNTTTYVRLDNLNRKMSLGGIDLTPLENLARTTPSFSSFYTVGYQYQLRGDWETALRWYQQAIDLEPYNSAAWLALANYYRPRMEYEEALAALETTLRYDPYSSSLFLALGAVQEALDETDSALEYYTKAILADPGLDSAYISQANLQSKLEDSEAAIETLLEALQASPNCAACYLTLAQIYVNSDDNPEAQAVIQTGLALMPGAAVLHYAQGYTIEAEISPLEEGLADAEAGYLQAQYQLEFAQYIQQIENYRPWTQRYVNDQEVIYWDAKNKMEAAQASYQKALPEVQAAQNAYNDALLIQPDYIDPYLGLARLAAFLDDDDLALQYYETALATNPTSGAALNALGTAYLEQGRVEEALTKFDTGLTFTPHNLGSLFGMTRSFGKLEDINAAAAAKALESSQFWWSYPLTSLRQ